MPRTGNDYALVCPSKKALKSIKDRVTVLTKRRRTLVPLDRVVKEVNTTLRGWVGCFHFRNCNKGLAHVRGHVEQRMRTHLSKRHKVRNRKAGYARISGELGYPEVITAFTDAESKLGRSVNPTLYSPSEIRLKLAEDNSFLKRVTEQEKIFLIGSDDDIPKPKILF